MPKSSHHTQEYAEEQVLVQKVQDEWNETVLPMLPEVLASRAKELKAFERARGLRSASDLLRGILAYALCLSSFRQVGAWAASLGISSNGDRSWAKRLRQARLWLLWLLQDLLVPQIAHEILVGRERVRVVLVDGSNIRGWHKQGDHCRLHVGYDLLERRIVQVVLTTQHTGESLRVFSFVKGDILVADRGYCRRQAIWDALKAGAELVVRLHWNNVPLQDEEGEQVDLCKWVQSLEMGKGERMVWMQFRKQRVRLRLLALRLDEAAANRAQRRHERKLSQNGSKQSHPWTKVLTDWLLVLTSLDAAAWSAEDVLALYRARWQIELLFKRIKQLVRIHRLHSSHLLSNEATLAALLVGWALVEQQAARLRKQEDQNVGEPEQMAADDRTQAEDELWSNWQLAAVLVQSLRSMILGCWTWRQIQQQLHHLRHLLTSPQQDRVHQESAILQQLDAILAALPAEAGSRG